MKQLISFIILFIGMSAMAAYQYNTKGNQGWLTFDSTTTVGIELGRSGKDKDHENFIDRGDGVTDYGWYNLDTGASGSFTNGVTATFTESDRIGLYVTDNTGNTYLSTKPSKPFEDDIWGKSKLVDGGITIGGGNMGSNGTHEYYVFKVTTSPGNGNNTPNGQPLPGIIYTLITGLLFLVYIYMKRKDQKAKLNA